MAKVLSIYLSRDEWREKQIPKWLEENFLGGVGLLSKILYDNIPEKSDPFSDSNIVGISGGPANGKVPYSGRFVCASKSPLTNGWGETHLGGDFAIQMNHYGYWAIFIHGSSDEPVDITIRKGVDDLVEVEITESKAWGKKISKAFRELSEKGRYGVLLIGPAGENLVRYATVAYDGNFVGGRTGVGAVLGSKNVKSIRIERDKKPLLDNSYLFSDLGRKVVKNLLNIKKSNLKKYGTFHLILEKASNKCLPQKNYTEVRIGDVEDYKVLINKIGNHKHCPLCPTGCKKSLEDVKLPEYESFQSLGFNLGIDEPEKIIELSKMCDEYGIDVISFGKTVSMLMEFYREERKGIEIDFGDYEKVRDLLVKTALREGDGGIIAEGSERVAIHFKIPSKYVMVVNGMEASGQDPRTHPSMALTWAIAPRGCDHLAALVPYDEGKNELPKIMKEVYGRKVSLAKVVKDTEDLSLLADSLVMCKSIFTLTKMPFSDIKDIIKYTAGDYEPRKIAENIATMIRVFNLRERYREDILPERFYSEKILGKDVDRSEFFRERREYYRLRGWDEEGVPINIGEVIKYRKVIL